jgi:methyl-accepting chemotaxis protein
MSFFDNLKVSIKLGILMAVAVIAMVAIAATGFYYQLQMKSEMESMYTDELIPVALINENQAHINKVNAATLELMLVEDTQKNQELKTLIDERAKKFNDNLQTIETAKMDDTEKQKIDDLKSIMKKYRESRGKVIELAMQNKNKEAYILYNSSVDALSEQALSKAIDLTQYAVKAAEERNAKNAEHVKNAQLMSLSIVFVALVLLVLSGLYITRIIKKPLAQMVQFCEDLSSGDFREKVRHVVQKDEIGQLGNALGKMRTDLRGLLKSVVESAEQVSAASEELTASAEQSAQAANQVAASITEVAAGAEKQLSAADQATGIVKTMTGKLSQMNDITNTATEMSSQATNKASLGEDTVSKAIKQMGKVEATVNSSADVVERLGERSKEIDQIVEAISNIAGQTNLLALNAAIEAARAGEHGRGFSVVAEEVRKLAEQSQEAAKQISGLISVIQTDTNEAVLAMNQGTQEVKIGTTLVGNSGEAFKEIQNIVSDVSGKVQAISASVEELSSSSLQIVDSVNEIDKLSGKSSEETQSVSAATEEQSASVQEIASASQTLANIAVELQKKASKFQI